jgi:hypothetical protein
MLSLLGIELEDEEAEDDGMVVDAISQTCQAYQPLPMGMTEGTGLELENERLDLHLARRPNVREENIRQRRTII